MLNSLFSSQFSRIRLVVLALTCAFLCIVPFLGTTHVSAAASNSKNVNVFNAASPGNACASFLQEYRQWVTTNPFTHKLNFVVLYTEKDSLSSSHSPLAGYADGSFTYTVDSAGFLSSANHFEGDASELFNDRLYPSSHAPFNYQSADVLGVRLDTMTQTTLNPITHTLSANSTVNATLTLKSWGNGVISFQPQCDHGVMYGSDNDHSLYTISLREYIVQPQG